VQLKTSIKYYANSRQLIRQSGAQRSAYNAELASTEKKAKDN